MHRELLLMRHGKYDPYSAPSDRLCELKDSGKRDCQRIGVWLDKFDVLPERTLCSPDHYSQTSAEKTIKAGGGDPSTIQSDERLYSNNLDDLRAMVMATPSKCRRLLLVGHRKSLIRLYDYLSGEPLKATTGDGKQFPKGGLIRLKLEHSWSKLKKRFGQTD